MSFVRSGIGLAVAAALAVAALPWRHDGASNSRDEVISNTDPFAVDATSTSSGPAVPTGSGGIPHHGKDPYVLPRNFDTRLESMLTVSDALPAHLESQMRDPVGWLQRVEALWTVDGTTQAMRAYTNPAEPGVRLDTAQLGHPRDALVSTHFPVLPAKLTLHLDLPDHRYHENVLVRWLDLDSGQIVGMEWVRLDGMAGSQSFDTRPAPPVEASGYRIDVFDAGESLKPIASTSIATGANSRVAHRNSAQ